MTKIIATIGPATQDPQMLQDLYKAGVNVFRLNFSHGDHSWHQKSIEMIKKHVPEAQIMLDTDGPSMRTGDLAEPMNVQIGDTLSFVIKESSQDPANGCLYVNHVGFVNDVKPGDLVAIDSAMIMVEVLSVETDRVLTKVLNHGSISSRRHLNLIQKDVSLPNITDRDFADLRFGVQAGVDFVALSFVRNKETLDAYRALTAEMGRPELPVYSKIETQSGLDNLEDIVKLSDGIMVARGDLGVETPIDELPTRQVEIITMCKKYNKPVIVATEMLESMAKSPRPTRAEVSDVTLAVWEGADFVMLSGETAMGKYPLETVRIMKQITETAEKSGIKVA